MIYFISDTHFYHKNIIEYENRPFNSISEMNETIIKKWNNTINNDDEVYHLGDFGFGNIKNIIHLSEKLNGKKYLIVGNHDWRYKDNILKKMNFIKIYREPLLLNNKFILSHYPLQEVPKDYINLYGHVHNNNSYNTIEGKRICLCVE